MKFYYYVVCKVIISFIDKETDDLDQDIILYTSEVVLTDPISRIEHINDMSLAIKAKIENDEDFMLPNEIEDVEIDNVIITDWKLLRTEQYTIG